MSNLILCFSEIPKFFICVRVRQGAFLSEDWKCYLSEAVLSFLCFRNAWKESTGKVHGIKRVFPSQQGFRFRPRPIQAGFTVHSLMIIWKKV